MSKYYDNCCKAANYIKSKIDTKDAIAIVLGSGLGDFVNSLNSTIQIKYSDIPNFPISTAPGHDGKLLYGCIGDKKILCLSGRWHLYEGYDPSVITMYVRVLKLAGVKCLILTNAAGAVNYKFKCPSLMLIDDFINFTGSNPLVGPNIDEFGPRFPDVSNALTKSLKEVAINAAGTCNIELNRGVYMGFLGPSYETPAEIRFARNAGADAVGMSTVHEILVAKHCDLPTLAISCLTNYAAGMNNEEIGHNEVQDNAKKISIDFSNFLLEIIKHI